MQGERGDDGPGPGRAARPRPALGRWRSLWLLVLLVVLVVVGLRAPLPGGGRAAGGAAGGSSASLPPMTGPAPGQGLKVERTPSADVTINGSGDVFAAVIGDRPVVLSFVRSGCRVCSVRQDALSALSRRYARQVGFLAVARDDTPARLRRYVSAHAVGYPVLLQKRGGLWQTYGVRSPGALVVLDRFGVKVAEWPQGLDADDLARELRGLGLVP